MKKVALLIVAVCISIAAQAQKNSFCFLTNIVMGTPMAGSYVKPWSLLVASEYNIHPRLSAGLGTGLSKYHHLIIPAYATLHWSITKQHRLTPFLASNIGYAFAPKKHEDGGFYLSPSVGVRYQLKGRQSLLLSVGYELQEYTQLQSYESSFALTQYIEYISNHALTVNIGVAF
ncbi:MAG: hypothetical protein K6F33_06190 [Bacteroidales bacterium]|nr:hypothetical protein [Bacteroidales bacterium]